MVGKPYNALLDDPRTTTPTHRLACSLLDELGLRAMEEEAIFGQLDAYAPGRRAPLRPGRGRRVHWARDTILEALRAFGIAKDRQPIRAEWRFCTKNALPPPRAVRREFLTLGAAWRVAMMQ
jgi:hypothetical protein